MIVQWWKFHPHDSLVCLLEVYDALLAHVSLHVALACEKWHVAATHTVSEHPVVFWLHNVLDIGASPPELLDAMRNAIDHPVFIGPLSPDLWLSGGPQVPRATAVLVPLEPRSPYARQ